MHQALAHILQYVYKLRGDGLMATRRDFPSLEAVIATVDAVAVMIEEIDAMAENGEKTCCKFMCCMIKYHRFQKTRK